MIQRTSVAVLLALALLAVAALSPAASLAQRGERCFPETGFCISGPIRTFWEQNGGLAVFGLPLGPQRAETIEGRTVQAQWFERHRLELHPENPAPYTVLLGRFGVERLAQLGRPWQQLPETEPLDGDAERCRFFRQTGYQVCDDFLAAFRANGLRFAGQAGVSDAESIALFGLPITAPQTETIEGKEYTVQWFERARMELHPENQPPFRVLFGRLGAELGGGQGGSQPAATPLEGGQWTLVSFGAANAPTPSANPASTLTFDNGFLFGVAGCNSVRGGYTATATSITFQPLAATLIACADPAQDIQEQAIFGALQGTVRYTITGDRLTIPYGSGQALVYRASGAQALAGAAWKLSSFGPAASPTPASTEAEATLTFDGGNVTGATGCNRLNGSATAAAATITFGPLATTRALCTSDALAAQEQAILTALQGTVSYSVAGSQLTIRYGSGQALVYQR